MAKLEAMLEQRGIATAREMSEAIARCQLHGGDLTTSLLQFVSADEALLSAALSECYGLPAAAVGALPAADDGALRSLPRDVAERYCCFPLEASPGRLVLAVAHPLEPALKEELEATLGVVIEERVALEVRIRQALSRHYGSPLSPRNQRGIARLEGDADAVGHETPLGLWPEGPLSALPRPPSDLPPGLRDAPRPLSVRPRPRSEAPRPGTSSAPPSPAGRAGRRREPITLSRAREELARASSRNEVLEVFFGFACQFFEYSALFAVHNSLAEGLDAWGKGADRQAVLGIGVPLDLPSSLSEAAESCKVRLTRLAREGIDRTLALDLERQLGARVLLLPVSLRGRCAVLLYADNGEADVVEKDVADLIALAPEVANALARIILSRKREASRSKEPPEGAFSSHRRSQPAVAEPEARVVPEARAVPPSSEPRMSARTSTPVPAPSNKDGVQTQPVVSIGPDTSHVTRAQPSPSSRPSALTAEQPPSGDDPVFLLARPQPRGDGDGAARPSASPPGARRPLAATQTPQPPRKVPKPEVSITVPARLVKSRPRLPSVIVDPESADPEASDRATRAAAITRAPTQARSGSSGRRPFLPPPAEAPRRALDDALDPRLAPTSPPAARARDTASASRAADGSVPSGPFGAVSSERGWQPAPARATAGLMPPAVAEVDPDSLEDIGGEPVPSSDVWPPPIMDHSPPPPHSPLTALVPIIIADPPKNRRGVIDRRGAARPGARVSASSPPSGPREAAFPTVPSPAGPRASEARAAGASPAASVRTVPSALGTSPEARARDAETIPAARRAAAARPAADSAALPEPASSARAGSEASATGSTNGPSTAPTGGVGASAESHARRAPDDLEPESADAPESAEASRAARAEEQRDSEREPPAAAPAEPRPHVNGAAPRPSAAPPLAPVVAPPRRAGTGTRPPAPVEPFLLEKTDAPPAVSHVQLAAPPRPELGARPPASGDTAVPATLPLSAPEGGERRSEPPAAPQRSAPRSAAPAGDATTAPARPLAQRAPARPAAAPLDPPPPAPSAARDAKTAAPAPASSPTPPASAGSPSSGPLAADTAGERPAIFPPPPPADSEIEALVEHVCQGDLRAAQDLARIGAPSVPQVMARFPGPVISERPSSRASECGPLLRALAAIGSPAMPSITKRSEDGDPRSRRWATLLLGEMPSLEACRAVVQRLADDEPRVHQAALDAARLLLRGPAAEAFRDTLFEVAEADDAPLTLRLRTLEHVAKLKDSASVPRLVAFLAADVEPIVHKALWALTVVTRHDFGRDARAWLAFWNENQGRSRIEWLIDALDPSAPRSNKVAADELREEAGELFGYAEDQSADERRAVQERFRTWWQSAAARRRSSSP